MAEIVVINFFLLVRVLLVGGILFMFPRIVRRGLLFGVYVGEEASGGPEAREVVRSWDRGIGLVMASALAVGLLGTLAGNALAGNLTGTGVLLVGAVVVYVRSHSKVKETIAPAIRSHANQATASLQMGGAGSETFAKITLLVCVLAALTTLAYALSTYSRMDDPMPTLWSMVGGGQGLTSKSYLSVLYAPSWNLVLGPLYAILGLMVATAKRSLREGSGSRSADAQEGFRSLNAVLFSGMALFVSAILTIFSVQVIRIGLGEATSIGGGIFFPMGGMLAFAVWGLIKILRRHGQGGALREDGPSEGALTGGLADNTFWRLGAFYVNGDDPSLMVESRFGIGYCANWGNPLAAIFNLVALGLILSLILLGFFL